MFIKERKHRLSKEHYIGKMSVAFTLCIDKNTPTFNDTKISTVFADILNTVIINTNCIVPAYCFMPDHQHIIISGVTSNSNILKTISIYKQKTGYWFSKNLPEIEWQKNFYDHIIRKNENLITQIKYILDNPVRKGLVLDWEKYPFKGSLGCKLEDILYGII